MLGDRGLLADTLGSFPAYRLRMGTTFVSAGHDDNPLSRRDHFIGQSSKLIA
jgi:hypothetical protein